APSLGGPFGAGLIHGLKLVAVAVVAQAVWDMARKLCPDWQRAGIAVLSIAVLGALTTVYAQLVVIALGAALGLVLCRTSRPA
ncbi:chromate ion family chromate transporter, partial [Salmonella sp. gx-f9]|nr:chromate ion family chromate transporter [Salmonella sp. gx-f9]